MRAAADRFFVDTNVLLYSLDPAETVKRPIAASWLAALWGSGSGETSWQVLNEFYSNAVRKSGLPVSIARDQVTTIAHWNPVGFGVGILERAWHWTDHTGIPYWDALIVAAAETAGCKYLLSEDFQPGQKFGGVTIVNPFRASPEEFGLSRR